MPQPQRRSSKRPQCLRAAKNSTTQNRTSTGLKQPTYPRAMIAAAPARVIVVADAAAIAAVGPAAVVVVAVLRADAADVAAVVVAAADAPAAVVVADRDRF